MLIDSHAHLSDEAFHSDISGVISRAIEAGITSIISISTNVREFEIAKKYVEMFPNISIKHVCGVPPHDYAENYHQDLLTFKEVYSQGLACAVGEIGLDFYPTTMNDSKKMQIDLFVQQLNVAREYCLPIVIHCRGAFKELKDILQPYISLSSFKPGILHCCTGSFEDIKELIDAGWFISFSGIVTFKKSLELVETLKQTPVNKILIETDAPYLSPIPVRGKRNEPSFLVHTAKFVADIKQVDLLTMYDHLVNNTMEAFLIRHL